MKRVAVIDYGMSNLLSVTRALETCGFAPYAADSSAALSDADAIVLLGVGAFGDGMRALTERGLVPSLREHAAAGARILGICLGMQMLFEYSEEGGRSEGLGLFSGGVTRLPDADADGAPLRVPHVGWAPVRAADGRGLEGTALAHLSVGAEMYFVHSFAAAPGAPDALAVALRGSIPFCAAAQRGNVLGCQFHPEKSGPAGLEILRSFFA